MSDGGDRAPGDRERRRAQGASEPASGAAAEDAAPDEHEDASPAATRSRIGRSLRVALVVLVLAAAGGMGVLASLLLGAGGGGASKAAGDVRACIPDRDFTKQAKPRCPPAGAKHYDGLVQDVTDDGFSLTTVDGEDLSFTVRAPDRPYIDVQHAATHASLGQPVRVYIERIGGEDVIVYMEDSALRF